MYEELERFEGDFEAVFQSGTNAEEKIDNDANGILSKFSRVSMKLVVTFECLYDLKFKWNLYGLIFFCLFFS